MGTSRQTKQRTQGDERPGVWVAYGRLVKLFRERAGLTQETFAEVVGYSVEQVGSIEQGRRPAKPVFTKAAETRLSAHGTLEALQKDVDLARLPTFFQNFASIESDAVSFFWYGGYVVPGLLQTEEYARALLTAHFPPLDTGTIDEWLAARMDRQNILNREKPPFVASFLIEEAVLHRPVGGPEAMKRQLHQLLKRAETRNVQIQIMPTAFGSHSGLNGSMVLVETPEHRNVAYIESQDIGVVISEPDDVSKFWLRYGMLRSQALNMEESARLIERTIGEL
ncbi:helix-turn-helix domain-containing protein [Streptomyces paludis]|uniref:XRE family transcriptional regulator n=1 Tax=Streptomyces paludis TaxID=2282738 RepID=A0A345HX63_9ACTN|nr:helix-turn-helix transcriptional regulator [Streptomyces paludis]AXG81287.1 XRE family transcriptional regulator [Streptomyces paludis]